MQCFYGALMLAGGGFLIVSFAIGEAFDFAGDIGDHFVGALDSALEAVHIDLIPDAFHFEGAEGDHHFGGKANPLSLRAVAAFAAFFGSVGTVMTYYGLPFWATLGVSLVSGAFGWLAAWGITLFFVLQAATTQIGEKDYIGQIGNVTVPIPSGGLGTVSLHVGGQAMNLPAQYLGGSLDAGVSVTVISKNGATLTVEKTKSS